MCSSDLRKCVQLSKGQARRVQLLLALAHRPSILLMDEPTDGLDHVARDGMLELLAEHLADTPTTALISTHRVYEIEKLVDHVGIIRGGRLLAQMHTDALRSRLRRYSADVPEAWQPEDSIRDPGSPLCGCGRQISSQNRICWIELSRTFVVWSNSYDFAKSWLILKITSYHLLPPFMIISKA